MQNPNLKIAFFGVDLMNELQQVLLIFAVVVIAGLYFLSRSRQNTMKKTHKNKAESSSIHSNKTANASSTSSNHNEPSLGQIPQQEQDSDESASEALNNLGTPHIPVSESTEKRITEVRDFSSSELSEQSANSHAQQMVNQSANQSTNEQQSDDYNQNQGVLSFGEEFDLPPQTSQPVEATPNNLNESQNIENSVESVSVNQEQQANSERKHHVLIVDDPGMTGEIDETMVAPDFVKPSFGIPEENKTTKVYKSSTNKEPEIYVLLVMTTAQEFAMTEVNQALLGVGLSYSDQGIFVKKDNMGNAFIKVANMLEPGTFPVEDLQNYATPGVAMILELPTTVRAPAAMHDLIIMARKVSQRLRGRLYNVERQLIKESDLQSMRDAALDYESEPIA